MLFTSLPFAVFFCIFFLAYWFVFNKTLKLQNFLILAGSYVFYAWWDWRFVFLLAGSSLLNYFLGLWIYKSSNQKYRSFLLWIGLLQGLGCLIFFKYFNFFIESFSNLAALFRIRLDIYTLNIILPLGVSFYTFKTIGYLLDITNRKFRPTTNWVVFFSYVSFFPCLISGPIDKPKILIPQLENKRIFNYGRASDGMRQILWGLFKKIIIADNCAAFTSDVFTHYKNLPASALLLCSFLSVIQVYADFSGYSDIAIGLANLLGFKITRNFNFPFFAQNVAGFWRRWHISLTSWFTEYVFTPLSINLRYYGKAGLILAVLINFIAIGVWHGPSWHFVLFGFLNGCYFIPLILNNAMAMNNKVPANRYLPSLQASLNIAGTFILMMFTFIFFSAGSVAQAFDYLGHLFSYTIFSSIIVNEKVNTIAMLICIVLMLVAEWFQQDKQHALQIDFIKRFPLRAAIYFGLILIIISFSATKNTDFIYFRF